MPRKDSWDDLESWGEEIDDMVVKEATDVSVEFLKLITQATTNANWTEGKTPVLSGTLMANHNLSIGSPDNRVTSNTDIEGSTTLAVNIAKLYDLKPYQNVYIQNNLDYASIADTEGWERYGGITAPYKFWHNNYQYVESIWKGGHN